jgi:hypothetical protein
MENTRLAATATEPKKSWSVMRVEDSTLADGWRESTGGRFLL